MAQPIEIVIRKSEETSYQAQTSPTTPKTNQKESVQQKAVNTALINAGKRFASYGVSQYGNLTGNTIQQRKIENALNIAGYVGEIAAGGWVGAISVASQLAISSMNNYIETNKSNLEAEMLLQRSGNATINGGRGTYD